MAGDVTDQAGLFAGHGHVWPRPDGTKARCGGPAICTQCSRDAAMKLAGALGPPGPEPHRPPSAADGTVAEALIWLLRRAGDEWGPAGVAAVACELAGWDRPSRRPADEARLRASGDAQVWAEEFCAAFHGCRVGDGTGDCVVDQGLMIVWFANAMETAKMLAGREGGR